MSKIKFSFSLILTIFLVGILSQAAFAASAYHMNGTTTLGADGKPASLKVSFNGYDESDVTGTEFFVQVTEKDAGGNYTVVVGSKATALDEATYGLFHGLVKGQAVVTPDSGKSFVFGKSYQVELYRGTDATGSIVEKSYSYFTDAKNAQMLAGDHGATKTDTNTTTLDKNGSGQMNANETGYNNTRKNRSGQKVHGFYQNNTNSCASCHQTHTGADDNLLFKDGIYSTCSACHDGTTGAYNSFAPVSSETPHSIAGAFAVTNDTDKQNPSIHEADGSLNVSAAPGGNRSATTGGFAQEFDCASCHSAHGNGTSSENNLNLDPLGWGTVAYATTSNDAKYGKLFNNMPIYASAAAAKTAGETSPYILVKLNLADQAAVDANYFYKRAGVPAGSDVIQTYRLNGSKGYVADYSLWLREKGYPFKADTKLFKTDGTTEVSNVTVIWRDGFAYGAGVADIQKAKVALGIDVETTEDIATLYEAADANYIPQSGVEMSKYCASCHTDYLSATRKDVTGKYTSAHRHQTATDELTCVRCHFGHGSDAKTMSDANDNTYYDLTKAVVDGGLGLSKADSLSYLKDPNPSSALKRYTGMAVCYACHGKGEQFLGNPNTAQKDGKTGQYLQDGQPGAARTDVMYNNN